MSDYNSSLPVRTENPGDVVSKIADATIPSQQLAISAAGEASVKATDLDIRDLNSATDSVTVVANDLDIRPISSATDSIEVVATNLDIRDLNSATDSVTVLANDLDIRDLNSATDSVTAVATDFDIRDLSAATDSVAAHLKDEDGNPYTISNPLPVFEVGSSGDPINNYKNASAIAGGASDNHDYTVSVGKSLKLEQIEASSSGKAKIEVQIESGVATGVFATRFVQFNSTASPNMSIKLEDPISVAAGVRVRVIMSNRENQSQDLYSTICGYEI